MRTLRVLHICTVDFNKLEHGCDVACRLVMFQRSGFYCIGTLDRLLAPWGVLGRSSTWTGISEPKKASRSLSEQRAWMGSLVWAVMATEACPMLVHASSSQDITIPLGSSSACRFSLMA